jgi:hypothetical protein
MLADADDAVQRFAAQQICRAAARALSADRGADARAVQGLPECCAVTFDGGDASLERGASAAEEVGANEFPGPRAVRTVAGRHDTRRMEPGRCSSRTGEQRSAPDRIERAT